MSDVQIMVVPSICEEGEKAALLGTHMSSREMPHGFTFVPYKDSDVIGRWNFLSGVVEAHFGDSVPRGEYSRWHRPQ